MDAFRRLSQLGSTVKERVSPVWKSAGLQFGRKLPKLGPWTKAVTLDAWARSEKLRSWIASHPNLGFAPVGVLGILYLLRI